MCKYTQQIERLHIYICGETSARRLREVTCSLISAPPATPTTRECYEKIRGRERKDKSVLNLMGLEAPWFRQRISGNSPRDACFWSRRRNNSTRVIPVVIIIVVLVLSRTSSHAMKETQEKCFIFSRPRIDPVPRAYITNAFKSCQVLLAEILFLLRKDCKSTFCFRYIGLWSWRAESLGNCVLCGRNGFRNRAENSNRIVFISWKFADSSLNFFFYEHNCSTKIFECPYLVELVFHVIIARIWSNDISGSDLDAQRGIVYVDY